MSAALQAQFAPLGAAGLAAGPAFQLLEQGVDFPAMVLDVGIEIRTSSHDHADALDLHIGDAVATDLPFELDRLAGGLVQLAVDDRRAVGALLYLAHRQRLAGILAEAL